MMYRVYAQDAKGVNYGHTFTNDEEIKNFAVKKYEAKGLIANVEVEE